MSCINEKLPYHYFSNAESTMPYYKYRPWCEFAHGLPFDTKWTTRKWPSQRLLRAPRWCSVDLRDGNQALVNPMDVTKKIRYFRTLLSMGFKEIEIGFPAASKLDFDFTRLLIEKEEVPRDVWLMVLVQAREHLIRQTIEALKGVKNVIIHLYNSTSELQRRVVFNLSKDEIKSMAVHGTQLIRTLSDQQLSQSNVRFEYSAESFTGTEVHFALHICHAVMDAWKPTKENPIILNLPETVQSAGPHFYADQIEWMHTHLKDRKKVVISVHPHNDRGTGVASAELAMLAGADRVEGCLFGNGERTGNVCLITLAVNLLQHGLDPELEFSDIPSIVEMYEKCTGMAVPERHPWVGNLVYSAFSGSHQDAIKKGLDAMKKKELLPEVAVWEVPYLPIDPKDLGRSYEAIIRINSQSGKGGVAFLMESEFGIQLPRGMQIEFSQCVQAWCDQTAKEITPKKVYEIFCETFLDSKSPVELITYKVTSSLPSVAEHSQQIETTKVAQTASSSSGNSQDSFQSPSRLSIHKRSRTATTPGHSEQSPVLSPKRRDLGKLHSTGHGSIGVPNGDSSESMLTSRITTTTSTTSSSSEPSHIDHLNNNPQSVVPSVTESFTSDWLVIDRPVLTDDRLASTKPRLTESVDNQRSADSIHCDKIFIDAQIVHHSSIFRTSTSFNFQGEGNGPIDAFITAFNQINASERILEEFSEFEILSYHEMAIGKGSSAEAICFIELKARRAIFDYDEDYGNGLPNITYDTVQCWGAARHRNTTTASIHAICSAINHTFRVNSLV